MDEHPAKALREKKDSTILVAMDLVKQGARRRARHRRPHRRRDGRRRAPARPPARRRPARPSPSRCRPTRGRSCSSTSARTPIRPPRTSPSTPGWARSSPSGCWASRTRASRCSRSARRRARATPGSSRRPSCSTQTDLNFVGNVEGKDLVHHLADVVVCDAVLGNVVIKFFEGLSGCIFDLFRSEFRGSLRGRVAYLLLRPGIAPDPRRLRLRAGRRVAAPRRPRHRDHHPRPGPAADGHVRHRRRGDDGPDPRPGAHRRSVRRLRAPAAAPGSATETADEPSLESVS